MHAILTAAALPLFVGALLSDWAYSSSFQVQWTNFAAWLNAGALPLLGLALLWAGIAALRPRTPRQRRHTVYVVLLAVSFVLGFFNALVHARDAWAAMPTGMVLSAIVAALTAVATVIGVMGLQRRAA